MLFQRIKRGLMGLLAAMMMASVFVGVAEAANPKPAMAADYLPNLDLACRYTYNMPNSYAGIAGARVWDPFANQCMYRTYSIPFGMSWTVQGGVDFQKYCNITYPGSRAVIAYWNVYGWRCRR